MFGSVKEGIIRKTVEMCRYIQIEHRTINQNRTSHAKTVPRWTPKLVTILTYQMNPKKGIVFNAAHEV